MKSQSPNWRRSASCLLLFKEQVTRLSIGVQPLLTIKKVKPFSLNAGPTATPADDAKTHFQAIGSGDLTAVINGQAANPQFNWVGGRAGFADCT